MQHIGSLIKNILVNKPSVVAQVAYIHCLFIVKYFAVYWSCHVYVIPGWYLHFLVLLSSGYMSRSICDHACSLITEYRLQVNNGMCISRWWKKWWAGALLSVKCCCFVRKLSWRVTILKWPIWRRKRSRRKIHDPLSINYSFTAFCRNWNQYINRSRAHLLLIRMVFNRT